MGATKLTGADLYHRCTLDRQLFGTTRDLASPDGILGQPRALEAIQLGIDIHGNGYNIFALGDPGTGKRTLIHQFLEKVAPAAPAPSDWCYVNNFDEPDKPVALRFPAGVAPEFSYDFDQFIEDVRAALPRVFETDEYRKRRDTLQEQTFEPQQTILNEINAEAEEKGLNILWTPTGIGLNPLRDGKPMTPEEVESLSEEERKRLEEAAESLQARIVAMMQRTPGVYREMRQKVEELNREVARQAFEPLITELKRKYAEQPDAVAHLDAVQQELMESAVSLIRTQQAQASGGGESGLSGNLDAELFRDYRVNVLVTRAKDGGAPVIYEEHPTYENLLGRVEYLSQMGTLITDFNLIKPGSLHRANGGYLILDAHRLLSNPFAYDGLKRALRTRELRIESATSGLGLFSTVSLEPRSIPLDVKVILLGTPWMYYALQEYDPDFPEMVKVAADFAETMDRAPESEIDYARLIADLIRRHELSDFDRGAVERVIEQSSIVANDRRKLSIRIHAMTGLLREASYWAKRNGNSLVTRSDVQHAVDAHRYRANRMQERLREGTVRGVVLIQTSGERVGQVNGLSVYQFSDFTFGHPVRITARASVGSGQVLDIEREVELGGPTHSKGILILQGYLRGRFGRLRPFSLSASLVFEQSYGGVEGDSATCAELAALLSSIAQIPVLQSWAITGSLNQHGDVQAIGGVNEKIEGFYDLCAANGLTGDQGVLIPEANVQHLMLREDIVNAVEAGRFHIRSIRTADDAVEVLMGRPAGEQAADGSWTPGSVNAMVAAKLEEAASVRKEFSGGGEDDLGA